MGSDHIPACCPPETQQVSRHERALARLQLWDRAVSIGCLEGLLGTGSLIKWCLCSGYQIVFLQVIQTATRALILLNPEARNLTVRVGALSK